MKTKIFKEFDINEVTKKVLAVSYSQLSTFLDCPRRWKYQYLLGLGEYSDSDATQFGTQIHASIEEYCKKLSEGYQWTIGEVQDLVEENLSKREMYFDKETESELLETHKQMMKGFITCDGELAELLDKCDVVAQEMEFRLKVDLPFTVLFADEEYNEVYLNGFIDLVLRDKKTGEYIVIDHKTGKSLFKPAKLKHNLQLPIYSLVIYEKFGVLPTRCAYYFTRFDKLQDVVPLALNDGVANKTYFKTGAKKGQLKDKQRTIEDINNELIEAFRRMYQPENLSYESKSTPICSWCPFGYYGDLRCDDVQFYLRKDIPLPKENTVKI